MAIFTKADNQSEPTMNEPTGHDLQNPDTNTMHDIERGVVFTKADNQSEPTMNEPTGHDLQNPDTNIMHDIERGVVFTKADNQSEPTMNEPTGHDLQNPDTNIMHDIERGVVFTKADNQSEPTMNEPTGHDLQNPDTNIMHDIERGVDNYIRGCYKCANVVDVHRFSELDPGDHIMFPGKKSFFCFPYTHHAIVDEITGEGLRVIQANKGKDSSFKVVRKVLKNKPASIKKVAYRYSPPEDKRKTKQNAEDVLEQYERNDNGLPKNYNLLYNNCETFVSMCANDVTSNHSPNQSDMRTSSCCSQARTLAFRFIVFIFFMVVAMSFFFSFYTFAIHVYRISDISFNFDALAFLNVIDCGTGLNRRFLRTYCDWIVFGVFILGGVVFLGVYLCYIYPTRKNITCTGCYRKGKAIWCLRVLLMGILEFVKVCLQQPLHDALVRGNFGVGFTIASIIVICLVEIYLIISGPAIMWIIGEEIVFNCSQLWRCCRGRDK